MVGELSLINMSSILVRDETLTEKAISWLELLPTVERQPIVGGPFEVIGSP